MENACQHSPHAFHEQISACYHWSKIAQQTEKVSLFHPGAKNCLVSRFQQLMKAPFFFCHTMDFFFVREVLLIYPTVLRVVYTKIKVNPENKFNRLLQVICFFLQLAI